MAIRITIAALLFAAGLTAGFLAWAEGRARQSATTPPIAWMLNGSEPLKFAWSSQQAEAHIRWCLEADFDPGVTLLGQEAFSQRCQQVVGLVLARNPHSGAGWALHAAHSDTPLISLARSRSYAPNEGWLARARLAMALRLGDYGPGARGDAGLLAASVHEVAQFEALFHQASPEGRDWLRQIAQGARG